MNLVIFNLTVVIIHLIRKEKEILQIVSSHWFAKCLKMSHVRIQDFQNDRTGEVI